MTKAAAGTIVLLGALAAFADDAAPKDTRTKAEIAADAEKQFARADLDGDGVLKNAEIPAGWVQKYDLDGDGKISRAEFVEVSTRPPKLRKPTPMRDPYWRAKLDLVMFDKNKDGSIGRDEYPGDAAKFTRYDKNKDGFLSFEEILALCEDEIVEIRKNMQHPNRYEFLVLFDADHDDKVTLDEYDGPMEYFKKYDKDGDGVVTYDELYPEKMAARMKKGDDVGMKPEDLTVLETMDKNHDGKVTRDEFKGTDDAFKRLDRNGDGVITAADQR